MEHEPINTFSLILIALLAVVCGYALAHVFDPGKVVHDRVQVEGPTHVVEHRDTIVRRQIELQTSYRMARSSRDSVTHDTIIEARPTLSCLDTMLANGDTLNLAHHWPESWWNIDHRPKLRLDSIFHERDTVTISYQQPRRFSDDLESGAIGAGALLLLEACIYLGTR